MINEKKYLVLLVLLAGVLLAASTMIRMVDNNNYTPNSDAYNNMRLYEQGNANYDSLQGHSLPLNILNLIRLNGTLRQIFFNIIPILLGLLSVVFTYLLLHKQNISEKTVIAIITLIIVSPIFLYVFTDYKIYSFIIFLNILGLYFLLHDKTMIGSAVFAIIPFIDLFSGMITLVLLLVYMFGTQKHHNSYKIVSIVLFVSIILSIIANTYYGYNIWHMFRFGVYNVLTDIGADIGISFSTIILAAIGLVILWENGWKTLVTYILLILFIVASVFNNAILIYLNFIIMVYAGFAFMYLNKRKWSIAIIKKTTILLIICSILFSTLVYTTKIVRSEPTQEYINGLMFLKEQSLQTETIMCSPTNAYAIEYYTERAVLVDESTKYYDMAKYNAMETIATSRNLDRTEKLLKEYNIKYIVIDKDFETYLKDKEGLLFIIDTSQKFTSIYKNDKMTIWMYIE